MKYSVRSQVKEFCQETSFLPANTLYKTGKGVKSLIVLVLCLTMTGFMLYQIIVVFNKFYSYPTQIEINLVPSLEQEFPSVTICNLNPIREESVQDSALLKELEALRDDGRNDPLFKEAEKGVGSFIKALKLQKKMKDKAEEVFKIFGKRETEDNLEKFMKNSSYNQWTDGLSKLNKTQFYNTKAGPTKAFNNIIELIEPRKLSRYAHQLDNMLISCRYKGYQCSPENFTKIQNYKYGRCYTFNPLYRNKTLLQPLTIANAGQLHGLDLELFVDQGSYSATLSPQAGIRVVIHKRGEMPFPEEQGFTVSPGHSTSVGIKMVETYRLASPHGICSNKTYQNIYSIKYDLVYSRAACLKSCVQNTIMKDCGCAFTRYAVPNNRSVKICNKTNIFCARKIDNKFKKRKLDCGENCPVQCKETRYESSMSVSVWPSTKFKKDVEKRVIRANKKSNTVKSSNIKNDVAKLEIYFNDLNFMRISEKEAYPADSLVSDLGGQLGLYMGISVLVLAEICNFFFDLTVVVVKKIFYRHPPEKSISPATVDDELGYSAPPTYRSPRSSFANIAT